MGAFLSRFCRLADEPRGPTVNTREVFGRIDVLKNGRIRGRDAVALARVVPNQGPQVLECGELLEEISRKQNRMTATPIELGRHEAS